MRRFVPTTLLLLLAPLGLAAQPAPAVTDSAPPASVASMSVQDPAVALAAQTLRARGLHVRAVPAYLDESVPGSLWMGDLSAYAKPSSCSEENLNKTCCILKGSPVLAEVRTASAFLRLAAFAKRKGHLLTINTAFRTDEQQACLIGLHQRGRGAFAAEVGHSNHQVGARALDIDVHGGVRSFLHRYAPCFGFYRRVKGESWHWEYFAEGDPVQEGDASLTRCLKNPRSYQRTHLLDFYQFHWQTIAADRRKPHKRRRRPARSTLAVHATRRASSGRAS